MKLRASPSAHFVKNKRDRGSAFQACARTTSIDFSLRLHTPARREAGVQMTLLTRDDFLKFVEDSKIELAYSFLKNAKGNIEYCSDTLLDPIDLDNAVGLEFQKRYFGDRLAITLGPIIKTHSSNFLKGRKRFKSHKGCFDIREQGNLLTIYPRETVTAASIERIKVSDRIAAFTTPRLSLASAGLLFIPSYIDPNWNGILQCTITNFTDKPVQLRLGEKIAICRFYEISNSVVPDEASRFPVESHHFGNNWEQIIETDSDPFPISLRPHTGNITYQKPVRTVVAAIKQYGLLATLAFVAFAAYSGWKLLDESKVGLKKVENFQTNIESVQQKVGLIENNVTSIQKEVADSGVISVELQQNGKNIVHKFSVRRPYTSSKTIWVQLMEPNKKIDSLTATLSENFSNPEETKVEIRVEFSELAKDEKIEINWLIAK